MEISFSSLELIIDRQSPKQETLNKVFASRTLSFEHEGTWNQLELDSLENRFYWLYSNFGKPMPHRDKVYNVNTGESSANPRAIDEVEPTQQFFTMYDRSSGLLYLSNLQKKSFIKNFIESTLGGTNEIIIKNVYATVDEFLDAISSVKSIAFSGKRDVFSQGGDLMKPLADIFGYGEPEAFKLEATYDTPLRDQLRRGIQNLGFKQDQGALQNLICIGRNDDGFEAVFNTNSFINKISIFAEKDSQELFRQSEVKSQLISKLKALHDV